MKIVFISSAVYLALPTKL